MNEHSELAASVELTQTTEIPESAKNTDIVEPVLEPVKPAPAEILVLETPLTEATLEADVTTSEPASTEATKKTRAPRAPKSPVVAEASSVTAIVERVVRLSALSEAHAAALGRLFNISLPDDQVTRLTRLTAISLSPVGTSSAEALTTVISLESANLIHVGVQLGRLAPTALPDAFRCTHALTGSTAPALPKGDLAVFAVADVLSTLTTDDFNLARALRESLA